MCRQGISMTDICIIHIALMDLLLDNEDEEVRWYSIEHTISCILFSLLTNDVVGQQSTTPDKMVLVRGYIFHNDGFPYHACH
jgi:hypothetical protein